MWCCVVGCVGCQHLKGPFYFQPDVSSLLALLTLKMKALWFFEIWESHLQWYGITSQKTWILMNLLCYVRINVAWLLSAVTGVYGHSTVYHAPSQSFYMYGGYMYGINRTFISNKLYAFHYPTCFWSILPSFEVSNPPRLNLVCIYACGHRL
jgi:hypothetical protein